MNVRCVECAWLQVRSGQPRCGFSDQTIPPHISNGRHKKAGPILRQRVAERLSQSEKVVEGSGMCNWALFEFAELSSRERQELGEAK